MGDFGEEVVIDGECGGTVGYVGMEGRPSPTCLRCHRIYSSDCLLALIDEQSEALSRAEAKITRLYQRGADTVATANDSRLLYSELAELSASVVADQDAAVARLTAERDAEHAEVCAAHSGFSQYFAYYGVDHEDPGCPEDDTCTCPLVRGVNEAFAALDRARRRPPEPLPPI